ncbi:NAD(P)/FAD-dependent oxidoreductase [Nocardia sp. CC227C]|uniref:flavin-containing monooxygenase n=1 Tax=Nocardia sp. CC227C TaxID=3044562 RepID=UPI00278C83E3|nr:NAD(P)-binding domain-containing protein [Nocardia sp. CC227C]
MNEHTTDVVIIGGGQSGLSAARAAQSHGLAAVVLEAGPEPAGSWPHYYDSLRLFSPAEHSTMPGLPFPGPADHYPSRDEVAAYLRDYAAELEADIRCNTTVTDVTITASGGFRVTTSDGPAWEAGGIIAASGSFGNPFTPRIPGADTFTGRSLHSARYREPAGFEGQRVVVVGAGNSAVQIGYELAEVATVTLATRNPIAFVPQRRDGQDLHYWLHETGFDKLPAQWLARLVTNTLVVDSGGYRAALEAGRFDRRPMFTAFHPEGVVWDDGTAEPVDAVIFATGFRPNLRYLESLGALVDGLPQHEGGLSTTHPGLGYVGLEFQRRFESNTLRGACHDAEYVMQALTPHIRSAAATVLAG